MRYEEIYVGQSAEIFHTITQEDINTFTTLCGDDNKLHVDASFASKTVLKKPVVHGMLGASFISTIIGTKIPGDGALWFSQSLDFLMPVRVDDTLKIYAEVLKTYDREKMIELKTEIYNQHKQKVTSGTAKIKVVEMEEECVNEKAQAVSKTALVVGSSGGIGYASALILAHEGWDLFLHYHTNKQRVELLKKEIEALGRKCYILQADLLNEKEIMSLVDGLKRHSTTLTALINCSTLKTPAIKFQHLVWDDIEHHIDLNIKANFLLIQALYPLFESQKYGKIVCITTQSIESMPPSDWLPYVTAKSALHGFIKSLAVAFAPKGIRVNAVSPGMTQTELISDISEKNRLLFEAKIPLKRLANPNDIANAIVFLVSNKSDYLTGETMRINGGQVML